MLSAVSDWVKCSHDKVELGCLGHSSEAARQWGSRQQPAAERKLPHSIPHTSGTWLDLASAQIQFSCGEIAVDGTSGGMELPEEPAQLPGPASAASGLVAALNAISSQVLGRHAVPRSARDGLVLIAY